jgi:hypothetical protein
MFFLWNNRYEYFFQGDEIETAENSKEATLEKGLLGDIGKEYKNISSNVLDEDDSDTSIEVYDIPVINEADCKDECRNKQGIEIEYKYCREICGLNEISKAEGSKGNSNSEKNISDDEIESDECDDIEDSFEEDICWKKKAIEEKNAKYCDEIYSEALGRVCQNRVLEEILN